MSPIPTTGEVFYAFIITRGARSNTSSMHNVHQIIVLFAAIAYLFITVSHLHCMPTLIPFPTSDYWHIFLSSIRNLVSINVLLPTEPQTWGLPWACFPRKRDVPFRGPYLHTGFRSQWLALSCILLPVDYPAHRATLGTWVHPWQVWTTGKN